jgi:RNA polymerase sigma factor (sigma-70 family)
MELTSEANTGSSNSNVSNSENPVDWSAVVRRHDGRLRGRVRRTLNRLGLRAQLELVDEIVQDVYCRLLEGGERRLRLGASGADPSLLAYIGTVAERTVLDQVRTASALKRTGLSTVRLGRLSRRARRAMERIADPGPSPEQTAMRSEGQRQLLDRCREMRGLGPGRRNAWVMRLAVLEGYSSREIAAAAGGRVTPHTIDMLVHRLRRRLARSGFALTRR